MTANQSIGHIYLRKVSASDMNKAKFHTQMLIKLKAMTDLEEDNLGKTKINKNYNIVGIWKDYNNPARITWLYNAQWWSKKLKLTRNYINII